MLIGYFTEQPYRGVTEEQVLKHGSYFGISNSNFDRQLGSDLYNEYLDEFCYAEELGFDAICLNEHHGNPFCMSACLNISAAVLARITEKVKLLLIGNPLPAHGNPLRVAEELAQIDLTSRGRVISGWVRGSGPEQFFNNKNPSFNREMFEEAHDFILQAWTKPGPWRYEGKHFHYRHVNPWALPYQEPYPPTMIPGVLSLETVQWAADRNYPYLGLASSLAPTAELWEMYADRAASHGFQAGPENFGYLGMVAVGDTEEEALELAKYFLFAHGNRLFARAEHTLPAGFNSEGAIKRLSSQASGGWLGLNREKIMGESLGKKELTEEDLRIARSEIDAALQKMRDNYQIIAGTPEHVKERIETILRVARPGHFVFMNVQGDAGKDQRRKNMRLISEHVIPHVRKLAEELDLTSQYDVKPGSRRLASGRSRTRVTHPEILRMREAA